MIEAVSHAQILKAIDELKAEMKADNGAVWAAITKLNDEVSTGRGAVKALVWVGSVILATAGLIAAFLNAFKT
jgi:hypothetical protein